MPDAHTLGRFKVMRATLSFFSVRMYWYSAARHYIQLWKPYTAAAEKNVEAHL
jgi:hypothetical protein